MTEETYTSRIAAELRADLGRSGKRQSVIAKSMEVSDDWLSRRLRGVIAINLDELDAICTGIGERPMAQVLDAAGATEGAEA